MSVIPSKSVIVRLGNRRRITIYETVSETVVEYPQLWFSEHPGEKPEVTVPRTKLKGEALSRTVYKQFIAQTISSSLIKAYLYDQLKDVSEVCPDVWKSYGVEIAAKGSRISVFGMLKVKLQDLEADEAEASSKPNDEALIANILCICRMNTLTPGLATTNTATQLTARYSSIYGMDPYVSLAQGRNNFKTWANDRELLKILAAIDMFFFRFSSHPLAQLRLGTVVFRFRNCAAIKSLFYVLRRKGFEAPSDLMQWIWTDHLIPDIDRIYLQDMAEAEVPYSYFPYFASLGISKKSPYSVTANPAIHAYCQAINVASGDVRGVNARLVQAGGMGEIIDNGLLTVYALGAAKASRLLFATKEDLEIAKETKEYFEEDKSDAEKRILKVGEPKTKDPIEWFVYFELGGKNSERFKGWKKTVADQIVDPRPGSFGEYMKRYLTFSIR